MVKQLSKMRDRSKANYIRMLQNHGKIKKIIGENGYLYYDTEELEKYKKTVKLGRPIKIEK